jgi:protein-export membrane protein SecD
MKRIFKLLFLPILSIALFVYVYTNQIQPKLGLDLQGGISVILTADEGTDKELIEQAVEIMRTRIAAFGEVQEPEISISGENSVLVQLPGITDQEKALQAVGTTGLLTFRPVLNSSLNIGYSPALDITQDPDDPDNPDNPIVNAPEGVDPITGITIDDNPNNISYLLSIRDGYPVIYELGPAELSGSDIKDALAVYPQNEWIVQLVLKEDSVQKFTDLTKKLASLSGEQRKLAIVLDNEVISAPGIAIDVDPNTGITGDTAAISMGNADQGESANNLAVVLRYGALPVSFERSSIQKVSATLGENTLNLGLQAGFVGLVIVSFFLLIYYRLNGLVAILGLSSFGALFYSVIALLGEFQGYTLTLAGIAGVIVSIGLTADSYIVIFEKLKDELKVGRSFNFATEKAVKEAWNTILVADFVSIIASVILYILAVGPIRGFALTLGVATVFDLFYTRLFIGNAVPSLGSITINPRFFYPLTQKDIADV